MFVNGQSRNDLIELVITFGENDGYIEAWNYNCCSCNASQWSIIRRFIYVAANCILANKVGNFNPLIVTKKSDT